MKKHRKLTLKEVNAYLDRAMANLALSLPDLQFDNVDMDLIDDEFLLEPAFGSPSAATSGAAPIPMSGSCQICIRVPARVVHEFKVQAGKTGRRYSPTD